MSNGIDTPFIEDAARNTSGLVSAGIAAVAGYLYQGRSFKQLLSRDPAVRLNAEGIYVITLWESGTPTCGEYFSQHDAEAEGAACALLALEAGQPASTPDYAAVDYDAPDGDLAAIGDYFTGFRKSLAADGYTAGVYGSGKVCRYLSELGLVSHTMLAAATGWAGYEDWKPRADIVQTVANTKVAGIPCDRFTTGGCGGGWMVAG
ncbi:MAG: DUF1906 domain-containing protein [Capsulimonadaceae bacterium]|nr:DUF1906 domain-containing protein [Capsulimonadaceae bacterium]